VYSNILEIFSVEELDILTDHVVFLASGRQTYERTPSIAVVSSVSNPTGA